MDKLRIPLAALVCSLVMISVCAFSSNVAAQMSSIAKGSWVWEGRPDKSGSRTYVGFYFEKQRGNRVSGTYIVSSMGGPDEDDTAGVGSIPFAGTVSGDIINLEYNPEDLRLEYETDFRYHKPKGKAPATAILKLTNGKLELRQMSGLLADASMKVPRQFTLELRK